MGGASKSPFIRKQQNHLNDELKNLAILHEQLKDMLKILKDFNDKAAELKRNNLPLNFKYFDLPDTKIKRILYGKEEV